MNVFPIKGAELAPKSQRSSMETLIITVEQAQRWKLPPFQRPLTVNSKVVALAEEVKTTDTINGVLTLGRLPKDPETYIVDGQHRREAFFISGKPEVIADIRLVHFADMAEMAEEYVQLNTALVRMKPDDMLRGLEMTTPALQMIKRQCPFVAYSNVRRNSSTSGAVLNMSVALRCWASSANETPAGTASIVSLATSLNTDDAQLMINFLKLAEQAWGRDPEYYRLWGSLNLTLCMWLYRQIVLNTERGLKRAVVLTPAEFKQCIMSLSANRDYLDWLPGRLLNDRDRSPAYTRIRAIFVKRIQDETNDPKVVRMPSPSWSTTSGSSNR